MPHSKWNSLFLKRMPSSKRLKSPLQSPSCTCFSAASFRVIFCTNLLVRHGQNMNRGDRRVKKIWEENVFDQMRKPGIEHRKYPNGIKSNITKMYYIYSSIRVSVSFTGYWYQSCSPWKVVWESEYTPLIKAVSSLLLNQVNRWQNM